MFAEGGSGWCLEYDSSLKGGLVPNQNGLLPRPTSQRIGPWSHVSKQSARFANRYVDIRRARGRDEAIRTRRGSRLRCLGVWIKVCLSVPGRSDVTLDRDPDRGLLRCWVSGFLLTVVPGAVSRRMQIGVSAESGVRECAGMVISSFFFRSPGRASWGSWCCGCERSRSSELLSTSRRLHSCRFKIPGTMKPAARIALKHVLLWFHDCSNS